MKTQNIAFAGGGTGGHVYPIKSLLIYLYKDKEILENFNKIFWFGTKNSLESRIAGELDNQGVHFMSIVSGKFRREKSLTALFKNIFDVFKIFFGIIQCMYLLLRHRIAIVFCKGGFVALPVIIAAWILRKKIYVHESDTVPGLTNRLAARFATKVFCGFPGTLSGCEHVGQVIGQELMNYTDHEIDLAPYDLSRTNILVIGGSQGAKIIFSALHRLFQNSKSLMSKFNFFIVLGTQNFDQGKKFQQFGNVRTFDFLTQSQMGYMCDICDVAITRGGATSMAEQKIFGIKLIIIPLPYTGGNHQYFNAKYYKDKYNDFVLDQYENLENQIANKLNSLINYKKTPNKHPDVNVTARNILNTIIQTSKNDK